MAREISGASKVYREDTDRLEERRFIENEELREMCKEVRDICKAIPPFLEEGCDRAKLARAMLQLFHAEDTVEAIHGFQYTHSASNHNLLRESKTNIEGARNFLKRLLETMERPADDHGPIKN